MDSISEKIRALADKKSYTLEESAHPDQEILRSPEGMPMGPGTNTPVHPATISLRNAMRSWRRSTMRIRCFCVRSSAMYCSRCIFTHGSRKSGSILHRRGGGRHLCQNDLSASTRFWQYCRRKFRKSTGELGKTKKEGKHRDTVRASMEAVPPMLPGSHARAKDRRESHKGRLQLRDGRGDSHTDGKRCA